jgi:TPR repeat protein
MNDELRRFVDLIDSGQSDAAEEWAKPRAERGDADGQFLMGYLVFGATRVDFRGACKWFQRAAAQGHPEALFQLSRVDQSESRANTGLPRNDEMRAWLRRAADLGSVNAQTDFAGFLATGRGGFPKDEREARAWYTKAAEGGSVEAQSSLGAMLLSGEGGPASIGDGVAWLEKAGSSDRSPRLMEAYRASEALETLVRIYTHGIPGIPPLPEKAAEFSRRLDACKAGVDSKLGDDEWAVSTGATRTRRTFRYQDATEAREVLRTHVAPYRRRTHKELAGLVNKRLATRLRGPSGAEYDVTLEVRWDDQPLEDVCVSAAINDYGWKAAQDIYEIFSMSPENQIVGDSF